jgi:endoglucanase
MATVRRLAVTLLLLLVPASALAAGPSLKGEAQGRIRCGSLLLTGDDAGGTFVFRGNDLILRDGGIACGLNGYTRHENLAGRHVQRGNGTMTFTGKVNGTDIAFEQQVSIEGGRVHVALHRTGHWPDPNAWCSFQMHLPIKMYGGARYRADGAEGRYPEQQPQDANIAGSVRRLECDLDDPSLNLVIEASAAFGIQDERQWSSPYYQLNVPISGGDDVRVDVYLTLPDTLAGLPGPRLCVSQIGYPVRGLKYVVMEWARSLPRPDDAVKLLKAGAVVREGRFGPTVDYDYMQSSFAVFDFSDLQEPGDYTLAWSGGKEPVQVRQSTFEDRLWEPTIDCFIPWEMCHASLDFGGKLPSMKACHLDDGQRVPANSPNLDGFISYECADTPFNAGDYIPCGIGGWHDAGDYDLNVPVQSYVTWKLALAYEEFGLDRDVATLDVKKQAFTLGKPDGVPDVLQQVEWGARWLLTMEQPDGRVFEAVCGRRGQYGADKLPDQASDGLPRTGDERNVYVDYNSQSQLDAVIGLSAAGRVLKASQPQLAEQCTSAASKALAYFGSHPESYRPCGYANGDPKLGRDSLLAAALAENYMTTQDPADLQRLDGMADAIAALDITWPARYSTAPGNFWYAPPVLARLYPRLADGKLKAAVLTLCQRAAKQQADFASSRPWPFYSWHFGQWGCDGHIVNRVFDAYYLEKVVPGVFTVKDSLRDIYWLFGLHPVSNVVFVCDIGYPGPNHLYNGRLHGLYGIGKPSTVPGAVVPGMSSVSDAGMLVYNDVPGNYFNNEACIYTAASYVFALNALKARGY